ncbi:AraC family transcriptional regulator [Mycobacterium ahvazicum]|uniref:AraC family transcriptional regulator n=1 Tax=Mycobacterium ahvazicum TaxID=1964395 RepID=A0A2K4Y6Y5_9MYCO|nr:AraC family transcriptional regulator [Mycobacterium ahvazicum]SOX52541.1 AraC family transcriptional regulator [Mycobacterium ahvazicum]
MTESSTAKASDAHIWKPVKNFDDFAAVCCGRLHMRLLTDPDGFSICHRVGRIGAATISEIAVGSETSLDAGELCGAYRIVVLRAGRVEGEYRGRSLRSGPSAATIYPPQGHAAWTWSAGTRFICVKLDRPAVDDALSDALGWQVMSQPEFAPVMRIESAATRSWINMVALFKDQIFRADSLLNQPLVGLPFVDSLVRGFLLAADHPHREALAKEVRLAPRAIRSAIEIIEEEAHLPLTLTSIATRTHISVRTLQQGFQRHLDTSPMAYLREVRLRRAHHALLRSDPSQVTVASVAYRWGFTNLGRFAAAHSARYRETPTETLRRRAFQRSAADDRTHLGTARRC